MQKLYVYISFQELHWSPYCLVNEKFSISISCNNCTTHILSIAGNIGICKLIKDDILAGYIFNIYT